MKYSIGSIVILLRDKVIKNRYLVVATKNQNLDDEYLNILKGKLNIKDIEKLASAGVEVNPGINYKICKCAYVYSDGKCILEGKFIDILDDDELSS